MKSYEKSKKNNKKETNLKPKTVKGRSQLSACYIYELEILGKRGKQKSNYRSLQLSV